MSLRTAALLDPRWAKHPYECTYRGCSHGQKYFSQRSHQGDVWFPNDNCLPLLLFCLWNRYHHDAALPPQGHLPYRRNHWRPGRIIGRGRWWLGRCGEHSPRVLGTVSSQSLLATQGFLSHRLRVTDIEERPVRGLIGYHPSISTVATGSIALLLYIWCPWQNNPYEDVGPLSWMLRAGRGRMEAWRILVMLQAVAV